MDSEKYQAIQAKLMDAYERLSIAAPHTGSAEKILYAALEEIMEAKEMLRDSRAGEI